MLYDLSNPLQAENFKLRCNLLYQKKAIVELNEKRPQRSLSQNKFLHAALGYFGMQTGYTLEETKDMIFKQVCNIDLFVVYKTNKFTGEQMKMLRSSADLTTEEMTLAIDRFRNWAARVAGIYIPSPEEHHMVMQMEIEAQRAKQYL